MSILQFEAEFAYPSGFQLKFGFEAGPGITGLLGPSGAGKTTTLHLIAGILKPHRGKIVLNQRTLFDSNGGIHLPAHLRRVGLVFQEYQLFPHLSVEKNLRFGFRRGRHAHIDFQHLVQVLELQSLLRRVPRELSGGQKQRVALGRAIASSPDILLLDEPLSALDDRLKSSVLDYLERALHEYQMPTILVTHDRPTMERLGARIVPL